MIVKITAGGNVQGRWAAAAIDNVQLWNQNFPKKILFVTM